MEHVQLQSNLFAFNSVAIKLYSIAVSNSSNQTYNNKINCHVIIIGTVVHLFDMFDLQQVPLNFYLSNKKDDIVETLEYCLHIPEALRTKSNKLQRIAVQRIFLVSVTFFS